MAVSRRLRFEVLRRDHFRCVYCGATPGEAELEVDHVIPVALGGSDEPTNLATACGPCNGGKSSVQPDAPQVADLSAAALRWRAAIVEARYWQAVEAGPVDDVRTAIELEWSTWMERNWRVKPLPDEWVLSVENWVTAGLNAWHIPKLMEPAMLRPVDDRWTYFCGTVWRHLNDIQRRALDIVDTDPSTWATQQV